MSHGRHPLPKILICLGMSDGSNINTEISWSSPSRKSLEIYPNLPPTTGRILARSFFAAEPNFNMIFLVPLFALLGSGTAAAAANTTCRCAPTDSCWPSAKDWSALNDTVDGRLIKTVPLGSACHDPMYNENECKRIQDAWDSPALHFSSASSVMSAQFAYMVNNSCDPFGPRETPCGIGAYAQYAVNVTKTGHIAAALKFAQDRNIRVTVKNTGHEYVLLRLEIFRVARLINLASYLGRSTGYGALAIWTHQLKGGKVIQNYQSDDYTGPALKVGAAIQVEEFYVLANNSGLMAVGGECASVGVAGGYTAGGGQSPLSSFAGLAADQTLEMEVVTANGTTLTVSPKENQDLFWANSGGGPGYDVVTSITYKAFPTLPVSGNVFSFERGNASYDKFWKAIDTYHSLTPNFADVRTILLLLLQFLSVLFQNA